MFRDRHSAKLQGVQGLCVQCGHWEPQPRLRRGRASPAAAQYESGTGREDDLPSRRLRVQVRLRDWRPLQPAEQAPQAPGRHDNGDELEPELRIVF